MHIRPPRQIAQGKRKVWHHTSSTQHTYIQQHTEANMQVATAPHQHHQTASEKRKKETNAAAGFGGDEQSWLAGRGPHSSHRHTFHFSLFLPSEPVFSDVVRQMCNEEVVMDPRGPALRAQIWSPYHLWKSQDLCRVQMDPDVCDSEVLF